jgi:hypothetical protein
MGARGVFIRGMTTENMEIAEERLPPPTSSLN